MRKIIMTAAAAFVIGGIATGAVLSQAQPAPPPAAQVDGAPPPPPRPWMGWMQHRHPGPDGAGWGHREGGLLRNFALVYRQKDRRLPRPTCRRSPRRSCYGTATTPGR